MGMILSLTALVFLLMVQVACYHAISAPIGTSSEIILKSGEEGTLQCGFKGRAQVVSWTYQGSSSKQLLLIKLDMLQQIGQRRVYGHGEGRYNISEDFSLIIHDVTDEDEGRYTCKVLESITCSLLSNYTFVSVAGMHSEVMLKSGEDGTLKCDIRGEAHVVYWTYQDASSNAVLLVRLELLQHQVGQRRVALYAEGRYNITDDFSLIIRDVTLADEGRYTCEILELTGSIVRKHNDVSVPEVKTVPTVLLESGKKATLTCSYKRTVYAVYWRYESTTSPMKLLIVLDYQEGERSGPGYDKGRFDINDDYSLIINDVEAQNEGRYTCEVSDFKTGLLLRNHTDVHTIVLAERPFVRIEQCEDSVSADDEPCVLHATSDHPSIQLTCTVVGAKPVVNLSWTSSMPSEHWKQVMNESTFTKNGLGDGTFNQTLTVNVETLSFTSDIQHFTCIAGGIAVDGKASLTISVYLAHVKDVNVTGIVVGSTIVTLAVTAVLIGITWKARAICLNNSTSGHNNDGLSSSEEGMKATKRRNSDDSVASLDLTDGDLNDPKVKAQAMSKRNKVLQSIQKVTSKRTIFLGVFGDKEAGKSSFINSLVYAVQRNIHDGNHETSLAGDMLEEWETSSESEEAPMMVTHTWRYTKLITRSIRIREINDDKKYEPKRIPAVLRSTRTGNSSPEDKDIKESDDLIHYPIFAFDISNPDDFSTRTKALRQFSNAVHKRIMQYPMLVLTKAMSEKDSDKEKFINEESTMEKLIQDTGIPQENILITIDYRYDGNKMELRKQIQLLDFILDCLEKVNIQRNSLKTHWSKKR